MTHTFHWEGTGNPNDPSGVAKYTVGHHTVAIIMDSFPQAHMLNRLIEKACDLSKQKAIDRAIYGISDLLKSQRYD